MDFSCSLCGTIKKPSHRALRCNCSTAGSPAGPSAGVASQCNKLATACCMKAFSCARGTVAGALAPLCRDRLISGDSRSVSTFPASASITSLCVTDQHQNLPLATNALRFNASSRKQSL